MSRCAAPAAPMKRETPYGMSGLIDDEGDDAVHTATYAEIAPMTGQGPVVTRRDGIPERERSRPAAGRSGRQRPRSILA